MEFSAHSSVRSASVVSVSVENSKVFGRNRNSMKCATPKHSAHFRMDAIYATLRSGMEMSRTGTWHGDNNKTINCILISQSKDQCKFVTRSAGVHSHSASCCRGAHHYRGIRIYSFSFVVETRMFRRRCRRNFVP